jgi:outer membrane protein assembly factor BamB
MPIEGTRMADERTPVQIASDPQTDLATLAQLAYDNPELRVAVAANPSAYEGLLEWLAGVGDPAVTAALAARGRAETPATQSVASSDPATAPASSATPFPVASQAAGSSASPSRALRFGIIGGAVAVVAVVAIVAVIALSGAGGQSGGVVPVVNLTQRPTVGDWKIENPFLAELKKGTDEDTASLQSIQTVATNQALVQWSFSTGDDDASDKGQLTLLNTGTGATVWSRSWTASFSILSQPGAPDIVLRGAHGLTSISRSSGATISKTAATDVSPVGSAYFAIPLDRILLASKGTTNLYSTSALTRPLWAKGIPSTSITGASDDKLFTAEAAYSLASGQKIPWSGALGDDISYFPADRAWPSTGSPSQILRDESRDGTGSLDLVRANDGSSIWHLDIPKSVKQVGFDSNGLLIESGTTLTRYSATTGQKLWSHSGLSTFQSSGLNSSGNFAASPVDIAQAASEADTVVGIDPSTGKELYRIDLLASTDSGSASDESENPVVLGASADVLYVVSGSGGQGGNLYAYDTRTGLEKWRISQPYSNWYAFRFAGGNLVAAALGLGEGKVDVTHDHPAIEGVR